MVACSEARCRSRCTSWSRDWDPARLGVRSTSWPCWKGRLREKNWTFELYRGSIAWAKGSLWSGLLKVGHSRGEWHVLGKELGAGKLHVVAGCARKKENEAGSWARPSRLVLVACVIGPHGQT